MAEIASGEYGLQNFARGDTSIFSARETSKIKVPDQFQAALLVVLLSPLNMLFI